MFERTDDIFVETVPRWCRWYFYGPTPRAIALPVPIYRVAYWWRNLRISYFVGKVHAKREWKKLKDQ